jgi:hypothetical protein
LGFPSSESELFRLVSSPSEASTRRLPDFSDSFSETVRKVPIGFNLKPQKPTKRVEEALLRCWSTTIRRLYTPL